MHMMTGINTSTLAPELLLNKKTAVAEGRKLTRLADCINKMLGDRDWYATSDTTQTHTRRAKAVVDSC